MPHEILWEKRGVYRRFSGHIIASELKEVAEAFYSDRRSRHVTYQVYDFAQVTSFDLSDSDLLERAAYTLGFSFASDMKRFAYVSTNPQIDAVIDNFNDLVRSKGLNWEFARFRDSDSALAWARHSAPE